MSYGFLHPADSLILAHSKPFSGISEIAAGRISPGFSIRVSAFFPLTTFLAGKMQAQNFFSRSAAIGAGQAGFGFHHYIARGSAGGAEGKQLFAKPNSGFTLTCMRVLYSNLIQQAVCF